MNIPAIGVARGIFELFVPGAFLILNVFAFTYYVSDPDVQESLLSLASNTALSLVVLVCFGYLAGVVMRLFRTGTPDSWSARLNRLTNTYAKSDPAAKVPFRIRWEPRTDEERKMFLAWAIEPFPYIDWIGYTHAFGLESEKLGDVSEFHERVWAVKRDQRQNKTFFNFCKTLVNSVDEQAASEIYSAEALNRYLTGMFYSLLFAMIMMVAGLVIRLVIVSSDVGWLFFSIIFLVYLAMLLAILRHYRVIRIKEAGIVFSATYRHRELFDPPKAQTPLPWRKRLSRALAILAGRSS